MSDEEELPPERQNEVLSDPYFIPDGEPEAPELPHAPAVDMFDPKYNKREDEDPEDNVDGGDGGGVFGIFNKAKDAAGRLADKGLKTGEEYLTGKMDEVNKTSTTGGAEYSLFDTVMLVFIILAILVLLYVVLAESGALSVAESGVQYLTGGCGCEK